MNPGTGDMLLGSVETMPDRGDDPLIPRLCDLPDIARCRIGLEGDNDFSTHRSRNLDQVPLGNTRPGGTPDLHQNEKLSGGPTTLS